MAKGNSGLSGAGGAGGAGGANALPPVTQMLAPPTPQQIASGNVMPQGGVPFSQFQSMTDDQKANVVNQALSSGVPVFLDDSGIQRFAYFTGMSGKPTVVSDSQLDKMSGTEVFRTVHDAYNSRTDIGYSSKDICDQISKGDFTMYSDSGGSAHGKAIYFADTLGGSTAYRTGRNSDLTMRAKITGGKGISESRLDRDYRRALGTGDKLAVACSKAGGSSARNLYGLAKGYTHISDDGWSGYHMILNRSCLTVSSTYKQTNSLSGRSKW